MLSLVFYWDTVYIYILTTNQSVIWKILNGDISTSHLMHFIFGSRVRFLGMAYPVDLLLVELNPRGGYSPSWQISNECVSQIGYPISLDNEIR